MERLFVALYNRFNLKRKRKMVSEYIQKMQMKKPRPVVDPESLRWTPLVAKSMLLQFDDVSINQLLMLRIVRIHTYFFCKYDSAL